MTVVASDLLSGGTILQRSWRVVAMVALAIVMVGLVPAERAWACSCAEPTVEEVVDREPAAAVVRVRRIDPDGGTSGVAEVREVLHGPEMPAQLPLAMDDGGSCLPWLAVGDVAVLTFVPDGDGWRTLECGRLDPRVGLDPLEVDPQASGPVAVVVAGSLPGADLLTLDAHLRVLAVGNVGGGASHGMEPCADDLLVPTHGAEGQLSLLLVGLPDLEVMARRELSIGATMDLELLAVSCRDDRVDVVTRNWTENQEVWLHEDVFAAERRVRLPSAEDAAFVGDEVLLLRTSTSGDHSELIRVGRDGTDGPPVVMLPGMGGHELLVAPDGRHAAVRGFGQDPVLVIVDLAERREVSRSTGWWQPVHRPWIGPDRLLVLNENSGGIGDSTGLADHRIVDLRLDVVAALEPSPAWTTAAGHDHVVQVDGDSFVVRDTAGQRIRTTAVPWAAGVYDALALGPIEAGTREATEADLPTVDPAVARAAEPGWSAAIGGAVTGMLSAPGGLALAGLATVGLLAALAVLLWIVRRRRSSPH